MLEAVGIGCENWDARCSWSDISVECSFTCDGNLSRETMLPLLRCVIFQAYINGKWWWFWSIKKCVSFTDVAADWKWVASGDNLCFVFWNENRELINCTSFPNRYNTARRNVTLVCHGPANIVFRNLHREEKNIERERRIEAHWILKVKSSHCKGIRRDFVCIRILMLRFTLE